MSSSRRTISDVGAPPFESGDFGGGGQFIVAMLCILVTKKNPVMLKIESEFESVEP